MWICVAKIITNDLGIIILLLFKMMCWQYVDTDMKGAQ